MIARAVCPLCRTWQSFEIEDAPTLYGTPNGVSKHDCLGEERTYERPFDFTVDELRPKEGPLSPDDCLRCRRAILVGERTIRRFMECCQFDWVIGECCEFGNRHGLPERTAEDFFRWGIEEHALHCAHRCADCKKFIEHPGLTYRCVGCGVSRNACSPTRCSDCFTLHRRSGLCPEEGESEPWTYARHQCPYCRAAINPSRLIPVKGGLSCPICKKSWRLK